MKRIFLNDILKSLGVNLNLNNTIIKRVSNDIRKISDNTLVFHLNKAEEINQELFMRCKDCYIITDQPLLKDYPKKDCYIFVQNINDSYRKFINYYRSLFDTKVIAVTGTCGKTTTKEMIAQVLKNEYKVIHTISSKNNLKYNHEYLLKFNDDVKYGVFETAITHPGHLLLECEIFEPEIGIITNIGIDHLNWCKSINNYIRTKAEMLVGLNNKGTLIINNDDENIKKIDFTNYKGKIITFGINKKSKFYARNIKHYTNKVTFTLEVKEKTFDVTLNILGLHNVYNALAALACLDTLGIDLNAAINSLSRFVPIRSHTEVKKGLNNSIIIDDTWSSNPTSLKAALDLLDNLGYNKKKIVVLGKISYLGKFKKEFYKQVAFNLIDKGIDILITIDEDSKRISNYTRELGMNLNKVFNISSKAELYKILNSLLDVNSVCLFKTSMIDKNSQELLREIIN